MNKLNNKNKIVDEREKLINVFNKYHHVLTTNQKQIFHLYYIEDLSLSEVADIVVTTRMAVYDALAKARKKLRPFIEIDQLHHNKKD